MLIVLDPLRYKIHQLLILGKPNSFDLARIRYGTKKDILELVKHYNSATLLACERNYIYIDLSPFDRLGLHTKILVDLLRKTKITPVILVMSEQLNNQLTKELNISDKIIICKFQPNGNKGCFSFVGKSSEEIVNLIKNEMKAYHWSLRSFRKDVAKQNLMRLLQETNCFDLPNASDLDHTIYYISGRYYRRMPNGMLVSLYINIKELGKKIENLSKIAYELLIELTEHFTRDDNPLEKFKIIITPSNTALYIASVLQMITGKKVIPIDRLGPIPRIECQRKKLWELLYKQNIILFEEIMATGNEVDRAILFLEHMEVKIVKIIALYNLEVGKPMLPKIGQFTTMCNPKKELDYVYRSE